ncbi:MAG: hypothetical protein GC178_02185 [Flavobacteriales bacterium]|nr:hypothetical protein [Flavobacteriales bacterium]
MKALLPIGYFPPISYFAYLLRDDVTIEKHEHFVKQSLRSRCAIMGANGPLNLLVPRAKATERQPISQSAIHNAEDWRKLHWRSLEAAYRNSPYFEYYEDELLPLFQEEHTNHFELGLESIQAVCDILGIDFKPAFTESYQTEFHGIDLRNAWNKKQYETTSPVAEFPTYIQVFSDRFAFASDLSILDLMFCQGPRSIDYLQNLELTHK